MTAQLAPTPVFKGWDNNGEPLAFGKLYSYAAGTTTPQATYTDSTQGTPNTNPVILNSRGECALWLDPTLSYKLLLQDSNGVQIAGWPVDNINGAIGINGSLVPGTDNTFNIGSTTNRWAKAYIYQNLYIGANNEPVYDLTNNIFGYIGQTAAELAAGVTPTNYGYPPGDVRRYGADTTGVAGSATAIQNAINSNLYVRVPDGTYLIDADLVPRDNTMIWFDGGAKFIASANSRTFFKVTTHAYYAQVWNAVLDGNGKTGVTGFDLTNVRLKAGLFNPSVRNMATGYILRSGCFGTQLLNPDAVNVPNTMQVIANCAVLDIIHPTFDNEIADGGTGAGIGIDVQGGGTPNEGVRIIGGFVQGYTTGVQDAGIGTKVDGTYFEACTDADVSGAAARGSSYNGGQHFAGIGAAAYKLRNCDAITIYNPTMASGARTVLYDVDNTNTNCNEYRPGSNASYNTPTGSLTNLSNIPRQITSTFTPVIAGSATAGAGTYTLQSGTAVQTGNQVHVQIEVTWTAHTGTGNILISGIPAGLAPASYTPKRIGQLSTTAPVTNTSIYTQLSGTGTQLSTVQVSAAGAESNIPLPAAASVRVNMVYDL
jgi:hypothetical protein